MTLSPIPLGFIIVILFIFSIKNKKSHIQQVCCVGLSALPQASPTSSLEAGSLKDVGCPSCAQWGAPWPLS